MESVTTRRARASDSAVLAEVAFQSYLPYVDRMGGQRPAPMDADYAGSIARDLVWVAEIGTHIAGFLVVVDRPAMTLLENVAVHPDWQGRGIGRLLIAIGEEHAKASGKSAVRLYTNAAMVENRRLYSHLGYAEVGRRVEDGFDRVFYEKSISCGDATVQSQAPPMQAAEPDNSLGRCVLSPRRIAPAAIRGPWP